MDDEAARHRERLEGLLNHSRRQIMWAECGVRCETARIETADGYNRRHHEEELERYKLRIATFEPEVAALEYAIDLIDRWEDAADDARFEDRG